MLSYVRIKNCQNKIAWKRHQSKIKHWVIWPWFVFRTTNITKCLH